MKMPARASKPKATKQSRHQAGYLKFRTRWRHVLLIDQQIRSGQAPNCRRLAQELEVSHRTVLRDIDFRRKMLARALAGAEIRPEDMNYLVEATDEYIGARIEEIVNTLYILGVQADAMAIQTCRDGRGGCLDSGEQDTAAVETGRISVTHSLIDVALEEVHVERKIIGFHAA